MKRFLTMATAALLVVSVPNLGLAAGPFDTKLSTDQQIVHALNRLTFGPRPGDVEEVKRIGLAKWIEQQLYPAKIQENPALEARLKPLETVRMALPDVVKQYGQPSTMMLAQQNQFVSVNSLLPQEEARKVQTGTAEERTAILKALDPDKRKQVLLALPQNVTNSTPEYKKEAEDARKAQQEERQKSFRKMNPQLSDLLNPDQVEIARTGSKDQLTALFAYLDPEKRTQVANLLPPQTMANFPELRREGQLRRQPQIVASNDLKEAKLYRAIYSNRQLEEVLVDFWYNHFNVDQAKNIPQGQAFNLEHVLIGSYERDAIRPHVFGHFKDLLAATAHHPAMLYYLDNWSSMAGGAEIGPFAPSRGFYNGVPNSVIPSPLSRIAHGLNENYGREIMELHTLGVKSGYTQEDVINVARCFTGWTVRNAQNPEFVFAPFMHDFGEKVVLGHKIPAGRGEQDGLDVIDILARQPATAKHISFRLAQRFVSDEPPSSLVDRMAETFTKTDGDLRAVLRTMFTSPEFFTGGAWQSKVKSPLEMVVSAVRAVGGEANDAFALVQKISDLGEPLYGKIDPIGYPNTGDLWLSTTGFLGRVNFSALLASGLVPGVKIDSTRFSGKDMPGIARELLGRDPSPETQAALAKGLEGKEPTPPFIASLLLGSPEFQRR